MNKDDVMRWAQEADAYADAMDIGGKNYIGLRDEHFATLVAAAEREACCSGEVLNAANINGGDHPHQVIEKYQAAIRARGQA